LIEEDHVGFDIEETEGDLSMAEGFEFERHCSGLYSSLVKENHPNGIWKKSPLTRCLLYNSNISQNR
jgi:hypothetical protein